jgi:hypothetical protein
MDDIQNKLNQCAITVRKFNLGDKKYFESKFKEFDKNRLDTAWDRSQKQIQHKEIIKNATSLTFYEYKLITEITTTFGNNIKKIYERLNSRFDVSELKYSEENVERRVRNILALYFLEYTKYEINELLEIKSKTFKSKVLALANKLKFVLIALGLIGLFSIPKIINGLTLPENLLNEYLHEKYPSIKNDVINVSLLTGFLHENSKYKFNGAKCNDGSTSHSQGRGTCSHHNGVNHYFYAGEYGRSYDDCKRIAISEMEELRKKAYAVSWRD